VLTYSNEGTFFLIQLLVFCKEESLCKFSLAYGDAHLELGIVR